MIRKLAHWLTRRPRFILTIALLLLIPSILGYIGTKVNYDVLSYLPENVSSVAGEKLLEDPFQAAATTMVIIEDMPPAYTDGLLRDIKKIDHVSNAIWVSDLIGIQVPTDLLPGTIRDNFYKDGATMMIVQLDKPLSSEESMEAIVKIRRLMNERCFAAGMTGMVQDIKELVLSELPVYTVIAVILTLIVLLLAFESPVITFLFLACIGLAIVYNMGTNIVLGQISYITQAIAAILQLAVTMDYSIFLYRRYEEEKVKHEDIRDAMTEAMAAAFSALSGSSLTTIAGFLSLCAMQFTLGLDLGLVMAKGIVVGILCVVLILPCFILIFDKYIEKWQHRSLFPDFTNFNRWILKHRRIWILGFVLMLIPSYYSDKHTEIYYRISQSLPEDLPSLVSQRKMEELFDIATEHIVIMDGGIDNGTMGELEARLEADVFLSIIKGKQFEFPVYYDVEEKKQFALGKEKVSAIMRAFLERVEAAGYFVGLYGSASSLTTHTADDIKSRYTIWLAHWVDQTNYTGVYSIWQHSEKGRVDGINGNVDLDIGYKNFPTIIKAKGLNGYGAEPVPPNPPAPAAEDGITVEVTVDGKKYSGKLNKA